MTQQPFDLRRSSWAGDVIFLVPLASLAGGVIGVTPALFENMLLRWPDASCGELGGSAFSGEFSPSASFALWMVICKGEMPVPSLRRRCGVEDATSSATLGVERWLLTLSASPPAAALLLWLVATVSSNRPSAPLWQQHTHTHTPV